MKYILGYTCQSQVFPQLKTHNTTTLKYLTSLNKNDRANYLKSKSHQNLNNLKKLLQKNIQREIRAFRITNFVIPHGEYQYYDIKQQHGRQLQQIGSIGNLHNMYFSFHASEYIVLNSKTLKTTQNSIQNLNFYGKILTMMKLKNIPNIIIHIGGIKSFNDFQQACDMFCQNYKKLNDDVKKYLVIQNDQNNHSIDSCMYIHKKIGIPVVFDHAHYDYKQTEGITMKQAMRMAMNTWKNTKRCPKIHLCSQATGVKIHNHGEDLKLKDFLKVYEALKQLNVQKIIMMLEVRGKDQALMNLRQEIQQYQKKNKIVL